MKRFNVSRDGKQTASVMAESADKAIRIACKKTGTNPDDGIAIEATDGRPKESGR